MQDSLAAVERFEVSGDRLTLHSEGGQVLVLDPVGSSRAADTLFAGPAIGGHGERPHTGTGAGDTAVTGDAPVSLYPAALASAPS